MINSVVLVGRITRDPELNKTQSGTSYCRFTVAVSRNINRSQLQPGQQDTDFINCIAWSRTAEVMCQYLRKGALIGVEGRINTSSFDNNQGQRVFRMEVTATTVQFLESRAQREQSGFGNNQGSYQQQNSYQGGSRAAYNSYQASPGGSFNNNNQSMNNNPFASSSANDFDSVFDDGDGLDIASDDLPF